MSVRCVFTDSVHWLMQLNYIKTIMSVCGCVSVHVCIQLWLCPSTKALQCRTWRRMETACNSRHQAEQRLRMEVIERDGSQRELMRPMLLLTDPVDGCKDCSTAIVRPTIFFFPLLFLGLAWNMVFIRQNTSWLYLFNLNIPSSLKFPPQNLSCYSCCVTQTGLCCNAVI